MSPRVRVVLQSRLGSTRLPGKALLQIGGRPLVVLAAQRAANRGHDVVVATSTEPEDDAIVRVLDAHGLAVHRGSLTDPLGRFVTATDDLGDEDVVVRLTADNVFPDGELVDLVSSTLVERGLEYARVGGDDLPYGVSAEAVRCGALRSAGSATVDAADREHVTPWVRRTHGDVVVDVPSPSPAWRGRRCTVDTFEDYVRVEAVLAQVADPVEAGWRGLSDLLASSAPAGIPSVPSRGGRLGQSVVIAGTVQLGLEYGAANDAGMPSDEAAAEVLGAIAASGISHVDTARAYGASEERIGAFLGGGQGAATLRVVTKVRPLDDLPAGADESWVRSTVEASVSTSLLALRIPAVDAVLTHRADDWRRKPVRSTLADLVEAGRCSVVGVSVQTPDELVEVLADPLCGYVQLPFNLLDHRWLAAPVQESLAARPDVTVTCRSIYLQGLLVAPSPRWPTSAGVSAAAVRPLVDGLVSSLGRESAADLCLAYVLGHDWVTSAVVGVQTVEQVRDLVSLAGRTPLTPDEIAHVQAEVGEMPTTLLDPSTWRFS